MQNHGLTRRGENSAPPPVFRGKGARGRVEKNRPPPRDGMHGVADGVRPPMGSAHGIAGREGRGKEHQLRMRSFRASRMAICRTSLREMTSSLLLMTDSLTSITVQLVAA